MKIKVQNECMYYLGGIKFKFSLVMLLLITSQALATRYIELHQWFHEESRDSRITSDRNWIGSKSEIKEGYRWVGIAGMIISPNQPQPPDTRALYTWYSPSRNDYRTTTANDWIPSSSTDTRPDPDYRFVRLEGYVYSKPYAGTLPLYNFWNQTLEDNHLTTKALPDDIYVEVPQSSRFSFESYRIFRTEGYIVSPPISKLNHEIESKFGIGNVKYNNRNGVVQGTAKVLVLLSDYSDVPMRHLETYWNNLLFNDATFSVNEYFKEISQNKFSIVRAGNIVGPIQFSDNPGTRADESLYNCTAAPKNDDEKRALELLCQGYIPYTVDRPVEKTIFPQYIRSLDDWVDFSRYDRNSDGTIDSNELVVLVIAAAPNIETVNRLMFPSGDSPGGITRFPTGRKNYGGCISVDGVDFCAPISQVGEGASLMTLAHELFHGFNTSVSHNDIYGSGSLNASTMAATVTNIEEDTETYHLDPWHKMRLGWAKPIVKVIGPNIPPSSARLYPPLSLASGHSGYYRPYVFYDPSRGEREMFIAEARLGTAYDSDTEDNGVAVWYAKTDTSGPLYDLNPFDIKKETWPSSETQRWVDGGGESLWTIGFKDDGRLNRVEHFRGGWWTFLKESYGKRGLKWYNENPRVGAPVTFGHDSGLSLRAGNQSQEYIDLVWEPDERLPFLARIDGFNTTSRTRRFSINGDFGIKDDKVLQLIKASNGSSAREINFLSIIDWSPSIITFEIPNHIRPGSFFLQISEGTGINRGNSIPFIIVD